MLRPAFRYSYSSGRILFTQTALAGMTSRAHCPVQALDDSFG